VKKMLFIVMLIALLFTSIAGADSGQDYNCYRVVVGKWYFYNRYTLTGDTAHLYGGWVAGRRTINVCGSRLAYYYGGPRLFYPIVGSSLWVDKGQVK
jgi:hypothetical protein